MDRTRNCIYIPSIDAKDLYLANNFLDKSKIGYKLVTRNGDINYNRFINSLDFSLDSEKLREFEKEVYKKPDSLTFFHNKKEYSDKIINITFKYSIREFNKVKKNTFVKRGYRLDDLVFKDCIAETDTGEIVGIIVDTAVKNSLEDSDLPQGFASEHTDSGTKYLDKTIPTHMSRRDLREYLYENGFYCNGKHYVRFKRTSGSARVGKCLFIEETLYPAIHRWEMCGLEINEGDPVDLAALESYISLPTSSAIDTLQIDPKSILVIPDYDSNFEEDSIIVSMNKDKRIVVDEGVVEVSNSIFDGQSLIDISLLGDYEKYGMVLLRNRFFKSCCFNTNIQNWFADNGITELSQLHPDSFTLADKIEDIKVITTPNSIKYVKFGSIKQWLENIDSTFSIVKHEKKTHFFNGNMVQAHYQLLNTLYLSEDEVRTLLKPSLDYVNMLCDDLEVFKYHVKCSVADDNFVSNVFKDKNDICYTMLNYSKDFVKTKYFSDFRKETIKSYVNNMKKGHILINGNYSVLFGNPYEMLLHTLGIFDGTTTLPQGCVHTTRYPYGRKVLGCRSPHISTSNVLVSENFEHELIDKYFNLTDEIVCINSIGENILERLSGADFDSDQIIISDNEILINAALKNYGVFKVPKNDVISKKTKRYYTNAQKADLDFRTSDNKIGEIVNLSQELNTLMWDIISKSYLELDECYKYIKDIYHDICALNVLSCIEIDKAKKEFDVSASKEIKEIREKWCKKTWDDKTVKPAFLGFIAKTKGYKDTTKKSYVYHKTSMDYLLKELNKFRMPKKKQEFITLADCFNYEDYNKSSVNLRQVKKVIDECETITSSINAVWNKEYYTTQEKFLIAEGYKDDLICNLSKIKMNKDTMFYLIRTIDNKKYSRISKLLYYFLFNFKHQEIIDMMVMMRPDNNYIEMDIDGDIEIYGLKFKRIMEVDYE